jgi:hypothetical protein
VNYKITIRGNKGEPFDCVDGVWSASNLHTALSRAVTGMDPMEKSGVRHVGAWKDRMFIGEVLKITVERI